MQWQLRVAMIHSIYSVQGPPKQTSTNSPAGSDCLERKAAKRARIKIFKSVESEDPPMKILQSVNDLWEAFGWNEATKEEAA